MPTFERASQHSLKSGDRPFLARSPEICLVNTLGGSRLEKTQHLLTRRMLLAQRGPNRDRFRYPLSGEMLASVPTGVVLGGEIHATTRVHRGVGRGGDVPRRGLLIRAAIVFVHHTCSPDWTVAIQLASDRSD